MIRIVGQRHEPTELYCLRVEGHGGTSLICAEVSSLVVALQGWVENAASGEKGTRVNKGEAVLWWHGSPEPFWMAWSGFRSLAAAHPGEISVEGIA